MEFFKRVFKKNRPENKPTPVRNFANNSVSHASESDSIFPNYLLASALIGQEENSQTETCTTTHTSDNHHGSFGGGGTTSSWDSSDSSSYSSDSSGSDSSSD